MKIEVWAMTDRVGSKCTREVVVADEDVEDLDTADRTQVLDDVAFQTVTQEMIEWGWREIP